VYHPSLPHEQILPVLRAAHVLFHPSRFEGLGTVFLEAAASGMAVITATAGAMRHVEELFGTGGALLVDREEVAPAEEASAFETHLRHLLRHPRVARRLAYHNFKLTTVGKLSPERNRRILLQVYERALEKPAVAPLTLGQIPHPGAARLRFSSRQLEQEERDYRRAANITQVRFLI
jgi:glycosyltransferase involved in cell wall biosynthesis